MLSNRLLRKFKGIRKCISGGHRVNDLFKIVTNSPDLWELAYSNIAPNKGAMTSGIDHTTLDGHSVERVHNLTNLLKENRYMPKPSKRVYIPKANGKRRPLGIPSTNDKLVQEVCRIILETIYEPIFHKDSHGFRPRRSCHTALEGIKTWRSTKWFIEVHHIRKMADIKDGKQQWQKYMIARNRKTMVLCIECHNLLHAGTLPDNRYFVNNKVESVVH